MVLQNIKLRIAPLRITCVYIFQPKNYNITILSDLEGKKGKNIYIYI